MANNPEMNLYYAQRAREYETVYAKPERQGDLAILRRKVPELLKFRHVYELACGTGYWTQFIAREAASIFATDFNAEVLEVAREKVYPSDRVRFSKEDAFALPFPPEPCNGGFAGFWWSHVRRGGELDGFVRGFVGRLEPGARLVFLDNAYVEGSSTPIARSDAQGNTYQMRVLLDGTRHEVLKNFPDEAEVRRVLAPFVDGIEWMRVGHYWLAWADVR